MFGFARPPPPPPPPPYWLEPHRLAYSAATSWLASFELAELGTLTLILAFGLAFLPLVLMRIKRVRQLAATAAAAASASFNDSNDTDTDDDASLWCLVLLRLRDARFSPGEALASIIAQLGQTAFLVTSSFVAVVAVTLQTLSQRSRSYSSRRPKSKMVEQMEQHAKGLLAKARARYVWFANISPEGLFSTCRVDSYGAASTIKYTMRTHTPAYWFSYYMKGNLRTPYVSIYLSIDLSIHLSIYLSFYLPRLIDRLTDK